MDFKLPKANTHPEVAKEQHWIPRTYLKQWSYDEEGSVWIYDKKQYEDGIHLIKVDNIKGISEKGYYDIKAGDIFMPDEALNEIFGCLSNLNIEFDGKALNDLKDLNVYYDDFDEWTISDESGNIATRKEKNEIKRILDQSRYVFIEKEWNNQFENQFVSFVSSLENNLRCKVLSSQYIPTEEECKKLMEHLLIFEFRNEKGNYYVSELLNILPFEELDVSMKDRVHLFNKTTKDELNHGFIIKQFYSYLKGKTGVIKKLLDIYLDFFSLSIHLAPNGFSFITSELGSHIFTNPYGKKEYIFVATPTMLISTFKKEDDGIGIIRFIKPKEVKRYNKMIANASKMIISRDENVDYLIH